MSDLKSGKEKGGREIYPLLPLRDIVVFPYMIVPLFVGRESSITAVNAVRPNGMLIVWRPEDRGGTNRARTPSTRWAPCAPCCSSRKLPDGRVKVLVAGPGEGRGRGASRPRPTPNRTAICRGRARARRANARAPRRVRRATEDRIERWSPNRQDASPERARAPSARSRTPRAPRPISSPPTSPSRSPTRRRSSRIAGSDRAARAPCTRCSWRASCLVVQAR